MYTWVIIFGTFVSAQGILLSILFLRSIATRPHNFYIALFFLALSFLVMGDVLMFAGVRRNLPWVSWIFDWLLLVLGPLVYLYTKGVISKPINIKRFANATHFLPAFSVLLWCIFKALQASLDPSITRQFTGLNRNSALQMAGIAILCLVYVLLSIRSMLQWRAALIRSYSNLEKRTFTWFLWLLLSGLVLLGLWVYGLFLPWQQASMITSLSCGVLIFVCGALGIDQSVPLRASFEVEIDGQTKKYARSATDEKSFSELATRLEERMRLEKFYLENDLSLAELAASLNTSTHLLSQTLNQQLGMKFYDYINKLRVDEVKRCLDDSAFDGQTVLEIALASGFASKSTFNTSFKKIVGQAPSDYRRTRLKE
jgi:AraC-like DNA-binding protein